MSKKEFFIIIFIIVAIVVSIVLDVYIATCPDIPLWAKLFWFLKD